jgi:DNA-binding CsgD family transcriptional regulator
VKAGDYLSTWGAQYPIPSMILAEDMSLLWSNSAADEILAAGKDFQLANGAVVCVDKAQGQEFRGFLATVGQTPGAWICCQDDTASQLVRAEAVAPEGLPPAVALMIYPIDSVQRYLWGDFHKVFGLTRAETTVVKRIVGGEAADAIAEDLSITVETVRTHVRRIYAKLGVNNREQLFSKVSAFRTL